MLTRWLRMTSILFLIETIKRNQFRYYFLRNKKFFLIFSLHFWNLYQIFNIFKQKMTLISDVFPKLRPRKTWLDKCLKSDVSEDPLTSNMVNGHKHSCIVDEGTFTIFIDHCESNWVGKASFNAMLNLKTVC